MEIPKIIHQTARSREFPPLIRGCVDSIRQANANWQHRFYLDEDWEELLAASSLFRREDLLKYPSGIQRADIFRCLALYELGGCYLDVDLLAVRSLDRLIEHAVEGGLVPEGTEVILSVDHPIHSRIFYEGREIYMNHFMIAKPRAAFLEIYLREMKRAAESGGIDTDWPLATTGPLAMTELIHRHGGPQALGIAVVPYFWVNPLPDMIADFREKPLYRQMIAEGTWRASLAPYLVHCWAHSWVGGGTEEHYLELLERPAVATF